MNNLINEFVPSSVIPSGRQDFVQATTTITFTPSSSSEDIDVTIGLVDDAISEEDEGFYVILEVNETTIDQRDLAELEIFRNITLAIIDDDDGK